MATEIASAETKPVDWLPTYPQKIQISTLARLAGTDRLIMKTSFRRKPGKKWNDHQRQSLIFSWLAGVPVPLVILNNRDTKYWYQANGFNSAGGKLVIDGAERIITAQLWLTGQLAVPSRWFPESSIAAADGELARFTGLTDSAQKQCNWQMTVVCQEFSYHTAAAEQEIHDLYAGKGISR